MDGKIETYVQIDTLDEALELYTKRLNKIDC